MARARRRRPARVRTGGGTAAGAALRRPRRPPRWTPSSSSWPLYDGGIESAAVWQLRDYVYARKDDAAGRAECEAKLLAFLKSPASPVARTIASRHLRVIAGDTAVPALQAMLVDDKSADLALYALQGIAGASRRARTRAEPRRRRPARRRSRLSPRSASAAAPTAVPALVPLLQQPALAGAAAVALGRIGGEAAASALGAAYGGATGALKATIAGALLEAASGFESGGQEAADLREARLGHDAARRRNAGRRSSDASTPPTRARR